MNRLVRVFSSNLDGLMRRLGVSQSELARRAGVSQSLISGYMSPERSVIPGLDKVEMIAGALGVSPAELFMPQTVEDALALTPGAQRLTADQMADWVGRALRLLDAVEARGFDAAEVQRLFESIPTPVNGQAQSGLKSLMAPISLLLSIRPLRDSEVAGLLGLIEGFKSTRLKMGLK
jgi:transcriptional regulator with XRE-family HTH domain